MNNCWKSYPQGFKKTPTTLYGSVEDTFLVSLFREAEEIWKFGSRRTMTVEQFMEKLWETEKVAQHLTQSEQSPIQAGQRKFGATVRLNDLAKTKGEHHRSSALEQIANSEQLESAVSRVSTHSQGAIVEVKLQIGHGCPFMAGVPRTMTTGALASQWAIGP